MLQLTTTGLLCAAVAEMQGTLHACSASLPCLPSALVHTLLDSSHLCAAHTVHSFVVAALVLQKARQRCMPYC
jgi:hypothetical protein